MGGGGAVIGQLARSWSGRVPFRITMLGLGDRPPCAGVEYHRIPVRLPRGRTADDLVRLHELDYARLCRDFERATTEYILDRAGEGACVLANDISEGPDFAVLAGAGVPVVTLWHVDVIDFFCRFYLHGARPERLARLLSDRPCLARFLPPVLRLVFGKQADCVAHSARNIVPSHAMRRVIERCHPGAGRRVEVVPWGSWSEPADQVATAAECRRLAEELSLAGGELVLLTLSRLSPEKGIERVLEALRYGGLRSGPAVRLVIAGEAAFMQGRRYRRRLEHLAAGLRGRVDFVGYATGVRKQALFELADVFLLPSRHESYGLTLVEALSAGLPCITTDHASARELVPPETGIVVPQGAESAVARAIWRAVGRIAQYDVRTRMGAAARMWGSGLRFEPASARVAAICRSAVALNREAVASP